MEDHDRTLADARRHINEYSKNLKDFVNPIFFVKIITCIIKPDKSVCPICRFASSLVFLGIYVEVGGV